jgi:hypothetical protein
MPFDPNIPATNAEATSAMFRGQFNGLKDLIDAVPVISVAQVDAVNTVPAGDPANAAVSVVGNELRFTFDIPEGPQGATGNDGGEGPQGPPFANAVVDAVNTLPAGDAATVDVTFDGTDVHFTFGLPQGNDGPSGADGAQGPAGPPGEVTGAELADAIADTVAGSSANSNGVDFLSLGISDPPTQAELQAVLDKLNELIGALRR